MFMVSFRMRKAGVFLGAAAILIAAVLGVMGVRALWSGDSVSASATEMGKSKNVVVKTNEQRLEFIRSFGWEVAEEPIEVMEVVIPKKFDSVYEGYNSMQKKQGYDLLKHAGKRCKRYSYEVSNYPGQEKDVRINIIVRDNKVIGGDVCSMTAGGFMHGFSLDENPA